MLEKLALLFSMLKINFICYNLHVAQKTTKYFVTNSYNESW